MESKIITSKMTFGNVEHPSDCLVVWIYLNKVVQNITHIWNGMYLAVGKCSCVALHIILRFLTWLVFRLWQHRDDFVKDCTYCLCQSLIEHQLDFRNVFYYGVYWASWRLKSPATKSFVNHLVGSHIKENTVKPAYNDHLMGYFSAFWSSSRWPRAT